MLKSFRHISVFASIILVVGVVFSSLGSDFCIKNLNCQEVVSNKKSAPSKEKDKEQSFKIDIQSNVVSQNVLEFKQQFIHFIQQIFNNLDSSKKLIYAFPLSLFCQNSYCKILFTYVISTNAP